MLQNSASSIDIRKVSGSATTPPATQLIAPVDRLELFLAALSQEDARSRLSKAIEENRRHLKSLGASIPRATNPLIVSLMESLKSLPASEAGARIAIVTALGRTGDPAILPPLLLVSGAASKDVRKAVAIALGSLRHPLAAYLLLPMLLDGSSRVRQSAFQALVQLNQPHTIESVLCSCLCSRTLRSVIVDTLRLIPEGKRSVFFQLVNESTCDHDTGMKNVADWLKYDFRNQITQTTQAAASQNGQSRQSPKSKAHADDPLDAPAASIRNQTAGDSTASPHQNEKNSDDRNWQSKVSSEHLAGTVAAKSDRQETSGKNPENSNDSLSDVRFLDESQSQNGHARQTAVKAADLLHAPSAGSRPGRTNKSAADSQISLDFNALNAPAHDDADEDEQLLAEQFAGNFSATSDDHESDSEDPDQSDDSLADLTFFNSMMENMEDASASSYSGHLLNSSSGSHATMSLSALLEGPEFPQRPAAGRQNRSAFSQENPFTPNTSHPYVQAAASNTSTQYSSMTPSGSMPFIPAIKPNYMTPQGSIPSMSLPLASTPVSMMPAAQTTSAVPSMDLTASSPFIDAFTPAFSATASQSSAFFTATTNGVSQQMADVSSASHSHRLMAAGSATSVAEESVEAEEAAAQAAKVAREKSLARLAAARDVALRKLVESAEEIPNALPRLLNKRVAKLMATPSTNIESVVEQIRYLGESGSPSVLSTLSSFCQKPSKVVREACADAIGNVVHAGSAVLLLKLLADKSGTVAEAAVKSLSKLDLDVTRPVLLSAGLCNNSLKTIVTAGAESASDEKKPEWEKFLLGVLQSRDTEAGALAVSLLVRITGDTHLDIYSGLVTDVSPLMRAAAVEALTRSESKRSISRINDALLDTDPIVRAQAAMSVATMYSPRSIELLQEMVFDSNLQVRRNAAQTMSRIDEADLAGVIEKALDLESDATTVEYLLAALHRNGGDHSLPVLQRYIEGEAGQFREQAVKALRKLKIPSSAPIFFALLEDRTAGLRRQSVEQLAALRAEDALPRLRELLKQDPDETVRSACAKALGDFADDKSRPLLEEALEDHPLVRLQAVIAMGRLGGANSGPALLALLKDSQPEVRYQAVRAVGQLKLDGSEEFIVPLLEDSDEMVRRGAEQSLQELGQSVGSIRTRRLRRRIVSLASKLMPSSIAGAVPGGSKTLLAVIVVLLAVGGYAGFSKMGFVIAGGEKLPVGRVLNVGISASAGTASVLRTRAVLDVWSVKDGTLSARVKVPVSAYAVISEQKGGVILLMQNEIGRLDPASDFSSETMSSLKLTAAPSAMYFHQKSNSLCMFENSGATTLLKVLDAATLKETQTFTLAAAFKGACVVSPDFTLALMLDSAGVLTLCDLKSGEVVTASVAQMTGQTQLGSISSLTFTDDMKYVCFCTSKSFLALTVNGMQLVKDLPSPDAYGFTSAQAAPGSSDMVVMAASGRVYAFSGNFETMKESTIERSSRFDLSAMGAGGELVVLANSEEVEFDVFSIKEQKMVLSVPGEG